MVTALRVLPGPLLRALRCLHSLPLPLPTWSPKTLDLSPPSSLSVPAPGQAAGPSRATRAGPMRLACQGICLAQLHTGQPKSLKLADPPPKLRSELNFVDSIPFDASMTLNTLRCPSRCRQNSAPLTGIEDPGWRSCSSKELDVEHWSLRSFLPIPSLAGPQIGCRPSVCARPCSWNPVPSCWRPLCLATQF